jgi:transcriptional regulator with XRE-family HTH domain
LLAERGMTQDDLAEKTGIRRPDVNGLARGRIKAGPDRLRRIAEALEVSVVELGAPLAEADPRSQTILDRQVELAGDVAQLAESLLRVERQIVALQRRLRKLEGRPSPDAAVSRRPRGEASP